jgi:hypothetical protein
MHTEIDFCFSASRHQLRVRKKLRSKALIIYRLEHPKPFTPSNHETQLSQALLNMIREINLDYDSRQLPPLPSATPKTSTSNAGSGWAADALSDFARLQATNAPFTQQALLLFTLSPASQQP